MKTIVRWGILWRSENKVDGKTERLVFFNRLPALYNTRREARKEIDATFGYIRERADLRAEPHGWKIPIAVRVWIGRYKPEDD